MQGRKKILFVCVGNSCRSQMAEGFANDYVKKLGRQSDFEIKSAGTAPAPAVARLAIEVMKERGIDISHGKPKKVTVAELKAADVVISMGCGVEKTCPAKILPKISDWQIEDPHGQPIEKYREVRDIIEAQVAGLIGGS